MTRTQYVIVLTIISGFYLVFFSPVIAIFHFFFYFVLANVENMCDKMHTHKART